MKLNNSNCKEARKMCEYLPYIASAIVAVGLGFALYVYTKAHSSRCI